MVEGTTSTLAQRPALTNASLRHQSIAQIYYDLACSVGIYLNLSTLESYGNLQTCLERKPITLQRLVKNKFSA